jgi:aspartate racemase
VANHQGSFRVHTSPVFALGGFPGRGRAALPFKLLNLDKSCNRAELLDDKNASRGNMQIGLIGGVGPAAQDYYTRQLIGHFADASAPLEMTTVYADARTLLDNLAGDRRVEQAKIFGRLADRLALAGATFVAVTSIAGHFCRLEFQARSPLPVVDMIDAVAAHVDSLGLRRIGILGTKTVMQSQFYGGIPMATVIAPSPPDLDKVHAAYVAMATEGTASTAQRNIFDDAARKLIDESGAQAILLGGTDLALVFDEATSPFPVIDCAAIHGRQIAQLAVRGDAIEA